MILQFSGGKDSLAVLHMYKDQITRVFFANTGQNFPEMVDFIERTCEKYGLPLTHVKAPKTLEDYHKTRGFPSDVVPIGFNPTGLQSVLECCNYMTWEPMMNYMVASQEKTVLRGQKKCDHHRSLGAEFKLNGITFLNPLWEWSDQDVFDYLKRNKVEVAKHYKEMNESFDCWSCTGHLSHEGGGRRLAYTKKHYPELWPVLKKRLKNVQNILNKEKELVDKEMEVALDGN
jgi:3'-phosphoadenosine 5'-phosphosulfate sulfotransferase (PAPS reductase)/FAD synthetase